MSAADDAYQRLQDAQRSWAGLSEHERDERQKIEKHRSDRARLKRRMWKPF